MDGVNPVPASSREAADPKPQSCPPAEQHERMRSMLQRVEWVRQSAGNKYACPICRAIADRDGGPGHTDDCELHQAIWEQGLFGKPAPAERGEARPPEQWMVVRRREQEPFEVEVFDRYDLAARLWDYWQQGWLNVWFCRVACGPAERGRFGTPPALAAPATGEAQPPCSACGYQIDANMCSFDCSGRRAPAQEPNS